MTTATPPRSRGATRVEHTGSRPTGRQIYKLAALLMQVAGLTFPQSRGDASSMIEQLTGQLDAIRASENGAKFDAGF